MKKIAAIVLMVVMLVSASVTCAETDHLDQIKELYIGGVEDLLNLFNRDDVESYPDTFAHMLYTYLKMYIAADMVKQMKSEFAMVVTLGEEKAVELGKETLDGSYRLEKVADEIWEGYLNGYIDSEGMIKTMIPIADALATAYRKVQSE